MTQVDRSQETRKEVRPGLTDNYTPAANVLIQGFPELSISERYVTIGLVSIYWDEKVYAVSLRELAAKIQIDHTMLRSRGGKRPSEGILDKLWRLGVIGLMEGKPITELGNKGRVQTYIRVNHRYIAEQNQNYTLGKKVRSVRSITVGNTNSTTEEACGENDNSMVGNDNDTVGNTNDVVGDTNHTVVHVSVKVPPKNSNNSNNSEELEKEDNREASTSTNQCVSAIASTPTQEEAPISYSPNTSTPSEEVNLDKNGTSATPGYRQSKNANASTVQEEKPKVEQQGLPFQVDLGPLVMPSEETKWCPETAVTISEVLRDRRYTPKQREKQISVAKSRIFARNGEFYGTSRVDFIRAFKARNDAWWISTNGPLTLEDLCAKGRLQKMLEKLGPTATANNESKSTTSGVDTFAHVPAFGGMTEEQIEAELEENLAVLRAAGIAV